MCLAAALAVAACGGNSPGPSKTPHEPEPDVAGFSLSAEEEPTSERGWLGVRLSVTEPGQAGVRVERVVPGSPADAAGMLPGDVLMRIGTQAVNHPDDVLAVVGGLGAGVRVALAVQRRGQDRLLKVHLAGRPSDDELREREFLGRPAPKWRVQTVQGSVPATQAAWRGKVVIVEFWAQWCPYCPLLVPTLNAWHQRWSGQGVELVGITSDSFETADRTTRAQGIEYAVAADVDDHTTRAYAAYALPAVFVIDQTGTVRELMVGYDPTKLQAIEQLVEGLLKEPALSSAK